MSDQFLAAFMHAARAVTVAERGLAVDTDLNLVARVNLGDEVIQSPRFANLANITLRQALDQNDPVVTNNIITNPAEAPVTNTNFSDLRVVVVIPVAGIGAIYLDQHIRQGVIPRDVIDGLHQLAHHLVETGQTSLSAEAMIQRYQQP